MSRKRLSVTVDEQLLDAAQRVVAEGGAPSLSAYVDEALRLSAAEAVRARAHAEHLAWFEATFGPLDSPAVDALIEQARAEAIEVRRDGTVVRGGPAANGR